MTRQKTIKEVEDMLGEPFYADFPEIVRKVRNNLIVISAVAIFAVISGVRLEPEVGLLGFKFNGLTPHLLWVGLLTANFYLWVHFCWYSHDYYFEWWLRLTGTRTAFITAGVWGDESKDAPKDPRQSTLYNWWAIQACQIGSSYEGIRQLDSQLIELQSKMKEVYEGKNANIEILIQTMASTNAQASQLIVEVKKIEDIFKELRIPVSLERFDNVFRYLMKAQNFRWFLLELTMPICIGWFSCALLFHEVWGY